jgi:hypothetical protein
MGQEPGIGFQIWVMNADGSAQTQLTTQGGDEPVFSPDGTRIAFRRTIGPERDGIVVANADDSGETVIAPPAGFFFMAPAFSPDGTKILASMIPLGQDRHQLVTMNPDGSDRQAVGIPDDVLFPAGTWAPAVAGDDGSCTKATAVAGSSNAGSTVAAPDGGVTVAAVVEGCGQGPCTYSSVATVAPSVAGARAAAKRAVVIGSGKLKLATGRTSPVKLRLGAAGRKLLVKKKTLKVTVTVTGKDARHKTVKKVARVKITAPKKS